jgi:outer membrane protein OmpA-like peptidoglycan-associated protein
MVVACTSVPARFTGADQVRERLSTLESNQNLAPLAPMAMKEARAAVISAEQTRKDASLSAHLVIIAERKVDIAEAESQLRYLESQRSELKAQRDSMQLEARTNESRWAKNEANRAKSDANQAKNEANLAKSDAREAQRQANQAQNEAAQAQENALLAQSNASLAQQNLNEAEQRTAKAKTQVQDMQRQLDEMDARQTARGAVVTLGDVLFDFNKSDIKESAISHLAKLAAFLNTNVDRNVVIEGHTDNVGAEEFNMLLSQQRADAVQTYLRSQGVASQRLTAFGKGELLPVTDNTSSMKRQQNRRVEVIISDPVS